MSARITIHCDTMWRYGSCSAQLLTDARTLDEAYAEAERRGWYINGTPDHCPACSGQGPQPADAVVAVLHPEEPR